MREVCPPLFEFPAMSFGWGELHFVYSWNRTNLVSPNLPDYVCYDERYCSLPGSSIRFVKTSDPSIVLSCQFPNISTLRGDWLTQTKSVRIHMRKQCSLGRVIEESSCSEKSHFQCDKKCLSKHRLVNKIGDCLDGRDEAYNGSCNLNDQHRLRCTSSITGVTQCIPSTNILAGLKRDCGSEVKLPHFPTLCNGYVDYREKVGEHLHTDETDCEEWQCDNQYTRCDGIWNCRNGADEVECFHPICNGSRGYPCRLVNTTEFICLPAVQVNDGTVECFGATDEQQICRALWDGRTAYHCFQNSSHPIQFWPG